MKIGLVAVDTVNFPNLPLMKLSAWHKAQGDKVGLYHNHSLKEADRIYMSKIFTFTPDYDYPLSAKEIIKGGTGYFYPGGGDPLPDEIEHIMPDYSIYNISDTAYGFLTRGCPRKCDFCIVSKKEGCRSTRAGNLSDFWNGEKNIVLLDPNLLAYNDHLELLCQLKESGAMIDFTQGLDIRLVNNKNIELIKNLKIKMIHFAWDKYDEKEIIIRNMKMFKETSGIKKEKLTVYVLCNYNTTIEQDLDRIYAIHDIGYSPYVMIYNRDLLPANHKIRDIQTWVNSRVIFEKCPNYEEYIKSKAILKRNQKMQKIKTWNERL